MLNLIKAELYRIFRSKALWITLIVLIAFLTINGLTGAVGTMGTFNEDVDAMRETTNGLKGSLVQLYQMATGDNLFYFFLPILVAVIATDFTNGTVRNVLARGSSRTKYYLSKLILSILLCSIFIIIYETYPLAIGTIRYGLGDYFNIFNYWRILLTQIPIYLAVVSLGTFIALTVKKTATLNAIYIPIFVVTQLIIATLIGFNDKFKWLIDYELSLGIRKYVFTETITNNNIISAFTLGISVIIITTVLGIILFRKSEIK